MVVYRKRQAKQKSRTDLPLAMIPMPSTDTTNNDKSEKSPEQETNQATNEYDNPYLSWQQPSAPAAGVMGGNDGENMYESPQNNDGSSPAGNVMGGNDDENTYFEPIAMYESPKSDDVKGGNDGENMYETPRNNDGSSPAAGVMGGNDDEDTYSEPVAMYDSPKSDDSISPAAMKPNPPHVVIKGRQSLMPK